MRFDKILWDIHKNYFEIHPYNQKAFILMLEACYKHN